MFDVAAEIHGRGRKPFETLMSCIHEMRILLVVTLMLAPTLSLADVLRCKIDGYSEDIFIATLPDTNSRDGQYAGIGISPGIGNSAIVVADRMGATVFVELNADETPIGLLTLQKILRVIVLSVIK
jgi:hypothetical protein